MRGKITDTYENYKHECDIATKFYHFTVVSYAMMAMSIDNEPPKESNKESIKNSVKKAATSYTAASSSFDKDDIKLVCEWIDLEEYSRREKMTIDEVKRQLQEGKLGKVHKRNSKEFVIWPKEYQFSKDLPEFGKKKFSIKVQQRRAAPIGVDNKEDLTALVKLQYKDIEKSADVAKDMLNRETFLLYWSLFEHYIQQIAVQLFELYPEKVLANKTIFDQSSKLTDIRELRDYIMGTVIGSTGGESKDTVYKTIEFIKNCFMMKDDDPYKAWYVIDDEKKWTSYYDLNEIRLIRNAMTHNRGHINKQLEKSTLITSVNDDGTIVVDDKLLNSEKLILEAVANHVYICIKKAVDSQEE